MSLHVVLAAVAVGLALYLFADWFARTPKQPRIKPAPPVRRGPHTLIAKGVCDEGCHVVMQSPLYDDAGAVLVTQVYFDQWGTPRFTRFAKANPLVVTSIEVGHWYGRPVFHPFGLKPQQPGHPVVPGSTLKFSEDPLTTWLI